jgi:hypothetical protein
MSEITLGVIAVTTMIVGAVVMWKSAKWDE